mgnify:FL=1
MFDKTKVKSMTKKKLNESEYSKLDSDIEKSILESIENDSDDFNFDDEPAEDATIDEAEGAEDGNVITEEEDFEIPADDSITEAEGAEDGTVITEDEEVPADDVIMEEEVPTDDLPIDLPESEGDDEFEIVDDITEEEIPAPADDEDFDLSDEDLMGEEPIEEIASEDQDPEMILDAEEVPATDPDLDFDLEEDAPADSDVPNPDVVEEPIMEEEDSEEKILEDLQKIEERKMKLEAAKAEVEGTDKESLITEVKKHKAALRKLASQYVELKEAYKKVVSNKKLVTESAQKAVKTNASLKLENFKAVKALAIFANADLKPATKMRIIEGFDACKDEKSATALYNTVVRKIKESAKSDNKLNQIVQGKKGTQKVVKESVQPKVDNRSVEEMRNDYMMGIDDAYESQFYKRYQE